MTTQDILLPEIGEGVMEGEIVEWFFEEGDRVQKDAALVSVLTDKATVEIPCPSEGILKQILLKTGESAIVGGTIAKIDTSDSATSESAPKTAPASQPFLLPEIGEGVMEGELVEWHVAVGDSVKKDQLLFQILTDKATVEITSPYEGTVEHIHVAAGETALVGQPVMAFGTSSVSAPRAEQAPKNPAMPRPKTEKPEQKSEAVGKVSSPSDVVLTQRNLGRALASPAVRRKAREMGIELNTIAGTGPSNRITMADLDRRDSLPAANLQVSKEPAGTGWSLESKRVPIKGLRKAIFENMALSKSTVPHFTYVEEIEMDALMAMRKDLKEDAREMGVSLSFMPFIMKATMLTLRHFPIANATVDEEKREIVYQSDIHLGMATATERGLMVPVIKNATQYGLFELGRKVADLSEKARSLRASMDEVTGSTFTITSLGKLGGVVATPIINYPEVGILGIYEIKERAVVRDGQIVIRNMMNVSGTFDHRIIDGDLGAAFIQRLKSYLEAPARLLVL